jgi:methyltransferase (TIGR00027 family)
MQRGQFSRTALGAAGHRAAHQVLEGGAIFADPLAIPILGADAEDAIARGDENPARRALRLFIAARSRFAEDAALRAIEDGVRQIVILGAGLDTFAYRLASTEGLAVFEVDHPATQGEKRRRLAGAGVAAPPHCVYVAHDFERGELTPALAAAGFDAEEPAIFLWLGVTPYLKPETIFATLAEVGALPGGAEIVFDYVNPPEAIENPAARAAHERLAQRVAAAGEPIRGALASATLHERARALGFAGCEDLGPAKIAARYFPGALTRSRGDGGAHFARLVKR